ncbi:uncharacterized protein LOC117288031 [Asterias rubens]|uniref:uncharacterized protein LOC117288031 n=1 Tax=Asterias rubens TaxID=7604 RepID=UPI001455259D|nr:uncharacterized protein LOC117288031 [Asterias rubens]XP_033624604.1 uncharacterized protein LOC117288031 [Asterias rubens]
MSAVVSLNHMASAVVVRTLLDHSDRHSPDCKIKAQSLISKLTTNLYTAVTKDLLNLFVESYPRQFPAYLLPVLAPPHLRSLNLKQSCVLEEDAGTEYKFLKETLKKCSKLQYLELDGCNLGIPMMLCDVITQHAPQLTSLSFEGCRDVSNKFVQKLLKGLQHLTHLNLSVCSEVTDNVFALSETQGLLEDRTGRQDQVTGGYNLSSVDLSGNQQLTSTCIRHLTELCGPRLRCLNVSATQMDCTILWFLSGYSLSTAVQLAAEANKSILDPGSVDGITLAQLITEFRVLQERLKNIQDEEGHTVDDRGGENEAAEGEEREMDKDGGDDSGEDLGRIMEEQKQNVDPEVASVLEDGHPCSDALQDDPGNHGVLTLLQDGTFVQDIEHLEILEFQDATKVQNAAGIVGEVMTEGCRLDVRTEDVSSDAGDEFSDVLSGYVNDVINDCRMALMHEKNFQKGSTGAQEPTGDDIVRFTNHERMDDVHSICTCSAHDCKKGKEGFGLSWAKPRERCLQCNMVQGSRRTSNQPEDNRLEEVKSTLWRPNRKGSPKPQEFQSDSEIKSAGLECAPEVSSSLTEGDMKEELTCSRHSSSEVEANDTNAGECKSCPTDSTNDNACIKTSTNDNACIKSSTSETLDDLSSTNEMPDDHSSTNETPHNHASTTWRRLYKPCMTSLDIGTIDFDATLVETCLKEFFVANKELKKLTVSWKELTDPMLGILAGGASKLQSLCLYDCSSLTSLGVANLMYECTNLKQLDLQGVCYIKDLALTPVFFKDNSCQLESIKLSETNISDSTLSRIANHLGRQITTLEVSWCEEIGDKGLAEIAKHCASLETLTLRQCPTTPSTLMSLAWNCQGLSTLNMSGVESLTDGVVQAMMPSLRLMKKLDMSWNSELTDVAVSCVMSCCPLMVELFLMGLKRITEKPFMPLISELSRWQRCKKLIKLKMKERLLLNMLGDEHFSSDEEYEDLVAPKRSTSYTPCLRVLELQYCDRVNDDLLAELVAICMGTLSVVDYYGMQIKPKLLRH